MGICSWSFVKGAMRKIESKKRSQIWRDPQAGLGVWVIIIITPLGVCEDSTN